MRSLRPGIPPEALLVPLVFGAVAVRLVQAIGSNSLWTDEAFTLGFAYLSQEVPIRWAPLLPRGVIRWIGVLSTAYEPHFPTHYVLTRLISSAIPGPVDVEHFVRLPTVLMTLVPIMAIPVLALRRRADALGWLLVLVLLAALVGDPAWREHAVEARPYGIMASLGVAMVAALHFGALPLAVGFGYALALIHPFGLFVGLAPAAVILARRGQGLSQRGYRVFVLVTGLVLAVLMAWLVLKFGLRPLSTSAAAGAVRGGARLLRDIDPWRAGAFLIALGGCIAALRRRGASWPPVVPACLAILGLLAIFAAALLLAPVQAFPRYVTWLNPVLVAMAASCAATAAGAAPGGAWGAAVRAASLAVGVFVLATTATAAFGPPWGNDLRGAARYLNGLPDGRFAVIPNSAEVLDYPPAYRAGLACFRGGQVVPHLSERLRRRIPCEAAGVVAPPADADRAYILREPVAWIGGRRIDLRGFERVATLHFGAAVIDVHDRRAPPGVSGGGLPRTAPGH